MEFAPPGIHSPVLRRSRRVRRGARLLVAVVLVLVFVAPASSGDDSGLLDRQLVDAAGRGDLGAVEALIAAGADPNARMDGYPALQLAVRDGTVEVVEALLAAGADVNAFGEWVPGCCQDRDTALHQAVRYWYVCGDGDNIEYCPERAEVIQVLLAAGADVNARDELVGMTPLHAAANEAGWVEVLEMLLMLLGAGADPNAQDGGGRTPLHFAADSISSAAIAVLLDAGADPDTRDEYYRTPLHRAACAGGPQNVAALLDAGAYSKARDHRGVTPLHIAADSCRSPAVIAMLLDAGADPKARALSGRTPWDFVRMNCGHGRTDAYRRLRDARNDRMDVRGDSSAAPRR